MAETIKLIKFIGKENDISGFYHSEGSRIINDNGKEFMIVGNCDAIAEVTKEADNNAYFSKEEVEEPKPFSADLKHYENKDKVTPVYKFSKDGTVYCLTSHNNGNAYTVETEASYLAGDSEKLEQEHYKEEIDEINEDYQEEISED